MESGITVIGTTSTPKHDSLRRLGAIPTTSGPGIVERVRELEPHGMDAALDIAGSGIIPDLIDRAGDPSRALSIADFSAREHGVWFSTKPLERKACFY